MYLFQFTFSHVNTRTVNGVCVWLVSYPLLVGRYYTNAAQGPTIWIQHQSLTTLREDSSFRKVCNNDSKVLNQARTEDHGKKVCRYQKGWLVKWLMKDPEGHKAFTTYLLWKGHIRRRYTQSLNFLSRTGAAILRSRVFQIYFVLLLKLQYVVA